MAARSSRPRPPQSRSAAARRLDRTLGSLQWWRRRWAPWAVLGLGALSAVPLALVFRAAAPEPGDRGINCGGIGFGESPCGWDAVGFFYAVIGVPYALTVVVVLGLLELGGRRLHALRLGLAVLAALLPSFAATAGLLVAP